MKSYASMLQSPSSKYRCRVHEPAVDSRHRHAGCLTPAVAGLGDRGRGRLGQSRISSDYSLLRDRTPSAGKVSQAMAESLWNKVARSQARHFVYAGSRSGSRKKSELSKSIEKIDMVINQQKRDHLLQNLSDFSSIKKSTINRSKIEHETVIVGRSKSEKSVHSGYKSVLQSILHTKALISPGRSQASSTSKLSFVKDGSSKSIVSNGNPSTASKKSKPMVHFADSLYKHKKSTPVASFSYKPQAKLDDDIVPMNKAADLSFKAKGKYALPDSFVYVAKSFKPIDASRNVDQILPTPKGQNKVKNEQESDLSQSSDISTEDMKYKFNRFSVPTEPVQMSSSSRELILEENPQHKIVEKTQASVKAQLVFQGADMSKKPAPAKAKANIRESSKLKTSLKPLTTYQVMLQKSSLQSFKPKFSSSSKKSASPREIRVEESESVRLINDEIERMIGVLKDKHSQKSMVSK